MNRLIWFGLLTLPGYPVLATEFSELFRPALTAIAIYLPLTTVPLLFKFLYVKVYDTRLLQESIWDYGGIDLSDKEHFTPATQRLIKEIYEEVEKEAVVETVDEKQEEHVQAPTYNTSKKVNYSKKNKRR